MQYSHLIAPLCPLAATVDISMIQNAVLELKIAGIKHLQHAQFVRLLGDSPSSKEERWTDCFHNCKTAIHCGNADLKHLYLIDKVNEFIDVVRTCMPPHKELAA